MLGAQASPPAAWQVNDPRLSVEVSHTDRAGGDACDPSREVNLDSGSVTEVNF